MCAGRPLASGIPPEHLHSLVPRLLHDVPLMRYLANREMRTSLLDTDSQGSVSATLGLKPELHLYDFLVTRMSFKNCIVNACEELDVICSDRKTQQAEDLITNPFAKSRLSKCSRRMRRQAVIIDYRDPNRYRLTIA